MLSRWIISVVLPCVVGCVLAAQADDPAKPPSETQQNPEREAVSRMLDYAWSRQPDAVRELYESLQKQVSDRPRWHHAYGVALLKLKDYKRADHAFQAAIDDSRTFSLASWKGLIWSELSLKRYDDGIANLELLARRIADQKSPLTVEERETTAVWIGQTLGALEKIVTATKVQQRIQSAHDILRELWSEDLQDAARSGRDYTEVVYAELMDELKEATDAALSDDEEKKRQTKQNLADKAAEVEQQRGELKKKAEEQQKLVNSRLTEIDKQLVRLERDYNFLQNRAQILVQTMTMAQAQLTFAMTSQRRQDQQQAVNLQVAYNMYAQEYEATLIRGELVGQRAVQLLETRQQVVQQSNQAVEEAGALNADLGKWKGRLEQKAQSLDKKKTKVKSLTVSQKRAKAKQLSTYIDFDPEWERIRIHESFEKNGLQTTSPAKP